MNNLNAVITGGTRGIGEEIVYQLARQGCNICFCYKNNVDLAKKIEKELHEFGVRVFSMQIDVADKDESEKFIKACIDKIGKIDILVNNAGIRKDKSLALMEFSEWDEVVNINLNSLYNITKPVIYHMIKNKSGHIVNLGSVSGITGIAGQTNYATTKAGVVGFTKSLAKEVVNYGIRVNAVAPGFIESDMTNNFSHKLMEQAINSIPLRRFGTVQEVANLVTYLVCGGDSYMTGQVFCIDGGISI